MVLTHWTAALETYSTHENTMAILIYGGIIIDLRSCIHVWCCTYNIRTFTGPVATGIRKRAPAHSSIIIAHIYTNIHYIFTIYIYTLYICIYIYIYILCLPS